MYADAATGDPEAQARCVSLLRGGRTITGRSRSCSSKLYSRVKRFSFSRLRGGRPLRGAAPKGLVPLESLFRLRAGIGASTVAATPCPPRQNGGGAGGSLRQIFLTASICLSQPFMLHQYSHFIKRKTRPYIPLLQNRIRNSTKASSEEIIALLGSLPSSQ